MTSITSRCAVFVGARRVDRVPPGDRGLAYGDGLFETMRAHRGDMPWWDAHWKRFVSGASRLRIVVPDEAVVRDEARRLLGGCDAVLKLVLTRGAAGRGYATAPSMAPTWLLSVHELPPAPREGGLHLRWCETRLARQPLLAGMKHCNRLEQVLARAEWHVPGADAQAFDEGLLLDTDGNVTSAIAANVFVLRGGRWQTPPVDACGVAGVCRAWLLDAAAAVEQPLLPADVDAAEAVILCNAVRGILPVARLAGRSWTPHPAVALLMRQLAAAHPAFAGP